jgi:hypothetical protein
METDREFPERPGRFDDPDLEALALLGLHFDENASDRCGCARWHAITSSTPSQRKGSTSTGCGRGSSESRRSEGRQTR